MTDESNERVFLAEGNIRVTATRVVVGGQTFAMRNVSSVKGVVHQESKANDYIFGAIGIALVLYGLSGAKWALILGAILFAFSYIEGRFMKKPSFSVVLSTSGGETEAFRTKDSTFAAAIVDAINQAMIARG